MVSQVQQQLLMIAKSTAKSVDEYINAHSNDLGFISGFPLFEEKAERERLFKSFYRSRKGYAGSKVTKSPSWSETRPYSRGVKTNLAPVARRALDRALKT